VYLGEDVRSQLIEPIAALGPQRDRLAAGEEVRRVGRFPREQEERAGQADHRDRELNAGHPAAGAALELSNALVTRFLGKSGVRAVNAKPLRAR
jgi:hypothetical protein